MGVARQNVAINKSIWSDLMVPGFSSAYPETWESNKFKRKEEEMKKTEIVTPEKGSIEAAQAALAAEVTSYIEKNPRAFMLSEPRQLTVKKKNDTYAKRPHIGGESFSTVSAYPGKRGALIFTFAPKEVADYALVEMSEKEATDLFPDFKNYIKSAEGGLGAAMDEVKKATAAEAEAAKNADKFEKYADLGFGSF